MNHNYKNDIPYAYNRLDDELAVIGEHGTNRYTSDSSVRNPNPRGVESLNSSKSGNITANSAEYKLARMKRDTPEYADKAINGEMSISAAYTEAGLTPLRRAVNMEDAQSAYNTLTKFMPDDVLQELIELLTN